MFFDPLYMIMVMPFVLLSLFASVKVQSTFNRYRQQRAASGMTGAEAASALLRSGGLHHVRVEEQGGVLSDYYDPNKKVLALSQDVYEGDSLASLGVAAHEAGHAFQDANGYLPLKFRAGLVPLAGIGSNGGWILAAIGLMFHSGFMINLGIALFSMAVLFYVVTLPVEYNASARAVELLTGSGIITRGEEKAVRAVLSAAALTYLAAALTAIGQLLYLIVQSRRN